MKGPKQTALADGEALIGGQQSFGALVYHLAIRAFKPSLELRKAPALAADTCLTRLG